MSNVASKEQISKTIYEEKTLENKGEKPSFSYGDFVSEYGSLYTVQNAIRFVESTNQIDELKISRGVLNFFSSLLHRYNFNASLLSECQEELHPRMVQIRIAGRYTATQKSTSVDRYKRMCQESGLLETKWVANGSYKVIALSKKFFLCFSLAVIQQERAALLDSAMGFLTRDFDLEKKKELDVKESEAKKLIKQLRPQAKDGNNHTGAVAGLSSAIKKHAQKIEYIKSQYPSDYKDNPDYLLQLMPPGIPWEEDDVVDNIISSAASLFEKVYRLGLNTVRSSPGKGKLKPLWDEILDGVRLNHKGINVDNLLVTNTVPFFQMVIDSFGLRDEIKVEVSNRAIWFKGAVIKGPRDDGSGRQLPAERHEDFIDEIERVRLAHIPILYSLKKD